MLRILEAGHLDEAARLVAAAFADSPTYVYICQGDQRFLQWMFSRNLWLRLGTRANNCVITDDELVCTFMLVTPDVPAVGLWGMLRAGILLAPLRFGMPTVRRLLEVKDWFEEQEHALRADSPYPVCALERMSVRPDQQGKGLGSKALKEALDYTDSQGWGVILATQLDRNVVFYQRLGFTVVFEADYHDIHSWFMRRPPSE